MHDIRLLRDRISSYLKEQRKIWILFDNLDKGWSTTGVDATDAIVLRCLIDAGRKIEREMARKEHEVHCIVFVRNDVYEHLVMKSADYGKEMRAVLDWTDPELLREMLRLRLISALGIEKDSIDLEALIPSVSITHYNGQEVVDYLIGLSLMRPRNLLKVFNYTRGFASNLSHKKIDEDDLKKGIKAYSEDLLVEFSRELTDVLSGLDDLLIYFLDSPSQMTRDEIIKRIMDSGVPAEESEEVLRFLIYYGILGLKEAEREIYIYDVNYDLRRIEIRINRAGEEAILCVHKGFWAALDVHEVTPEK